jgi:hypothetical protein
MPNGVLTKPPLLEDPALSLPKTAKPLACLPPRVPNGDAVGGEALSAPNGDVLELAKAPKPDDANAEADV